MNNGKNGAIGRFERRTLTTLLLISASVSIIVSLFTLWRTGAREREDRRREMFSKAYAAIQEYKEFPYVIRRRGTSDPEKERLRISTELKRIQVELSFYSAWLKTESSKVHRAFDDLLTQTRLIAGGAMRESWKKPAVGCDLQMNISDIDLTGLSKYESAYLEEVTDHLSIWPRSALRLCRGIRRWVMGDE